VPTYYFKSDAASGDVRAATLDAAARKWAVDEGIRGVRDLRGLLAAYDRIGDGAWVWVEDSRGRVFASSDSPLTENNPAIPSRWTPAMVSRKGGQIQIRIGRRR
jgi:hypothetical protein